MLKRSDSVNPNVRPYHARKWEMGRCPPRIPLGWPVEPRGEGDVSQVIRAHSDAGIIRRIAL